MGQLIIDLKNIELTGAQRKKLHKALHKVVATQIKTLPAAAKASKAGAQNLTPAAGTPANFEVTFSNATVNKSTVTITSRAGSKTLQKSGTVKLNVRSGELVTVTGSSPGNTTVTIDVNAKPMQLNFEQGQIDGVFFIK